MCLSWYKSARLRPAETITRLKPKKKETELKELADKVFHENKGKRRKEKIEILKTEINEIIKDEKATKEFVKTYKPTPMPQGLFVLPFGTIA